MRDKAMLGVPAPPFVLAQGVGVFDFTKWALPSGLPIPQGAQVFATQAPPRREWYTLAAAQRAAGMRCHLVTHVPLALTGREALGIRTRTTIQAASGLFDTIAAVRVLCGGHPIDAPGNVRILIGVGPLWQWDASPEATLRLDESEPAAWAGGLDRVRTLAAQGRCAVWLPTSADITAVTGIADAVESTGASVELFADRAWITNGNVDARVIDIRWASEYADRVVMVQSSNDGG